MSTDPYWYAIVSESAPVINTTRKREDVAQELADKLREAHPDVEVVPLYRSARAGDGNVPAVGWTGNADADLALILLDRLDDTGEGNAIRIEQLEGLVRKLAAAPAAAPAKLEDIEQYRLQMAGISTSALGYWKEGDGIHPDYDTLALRDVAKLYAKYDALYKARVSWTPVTESLPEDRAEVLFYSGDLRNPANMLLGLYIDGDFCCAGYTMVNVTHWAKKPAQPDIEPPEVDFPCAATGDAA